MKCYACGDIGHKEGDCRGRQRAVPADVSIRVPVPTFVINVRGLSRVTMREGERSAYVIPPFGLEVTIDLLRVQHVGDSVVFFGQPSREHCFGLLLPNVHRPVSIRWGQYRLVVNERFIIDDAGMRTVGALADAQRPDFGWFVRCEGSVASTFGVDYFVRGSISKYRAFVQGNDVVVVPAEVAMRLREWIREDRERTEREKAEQLERDMVAITNEMIDVAVGAVDGIHLETNDD